MIEFNVTPTRTASGHQDDAVAQSLRDRTARWWTCSDVKLEQFGDIALAVESNVVTGAFAITSWQREPATGKVELTLADLPAAHLACGWVGQSAPIPWEPGHRQPFKYVSRKGLMPASPSDQVGQDPHKLIADLAQAGWYQLSRAHRSDAGPIARLSRAYETFQLVARLAVQGTPIPGGPRLLQPIPELGKTVTHVRRELSGKIEYLLSRPGVGADVDLIIEEILEALRMIHRRALDSRRSDG
ncbi:hypothetical protein [Nocardia pseudobrasiliensis]|uniref:Uncharacterized protein n=1 Tax=Nocardia pseudobrasiliensis TaxID=45979 RepID=A0A370I522_9NOCA|nr:hypothetical protein [Nocardia pseudobrasiliensis]RDI65700.1 hypothetical protein DFR76_10515 [Nocardia pseudobrasiliensis]